MMMLLKVLKLVWDKSMKSNLLLFKIDNQNLYWLGAMLLSQGHLILRSWRHHFLYQARERERDQPITHSSIRFVEKVISLSLTDLPCDLFHFLCLLFSVTGDPRRLQLARIDNSNKKLICSPFPFVTRK